VDIPLPVAAAVLGAALLHAAWNALVKASSDKDLDTVSVAVGSGALAAVLLPWLARSTLRASISRAPRKSDRA